MVKTRSRLGDIVEKFTWDIFSATG